MPEPPINQWSTEVKFLSDDPSLLDQLTVYLLERWTKEYAQVPAALPPPEPPLDEEDLELLQPSVFQVTNFNVFNCFCKLIYDVSVRDDPREKWPSYHESEAYLGVRLYDGKVQAAWCAEPSFEFADRKIDDLESLFVPEITRLTPEATVAFAKVMAKHFLEPTTNTKGEFLLSGGRMSYVKQESGIVWYHYNSVGEREEDEAACKSMSEKLLPFLKEMDEQDAQERENSDKV